VFANRPGSKPKNRDMYVFYDIVWLIVVVFFFLFLPSLPSPPPLPFFFIGCLFTCLL
jgi:hypothetical protein